jgi:hypothetical protein
MEYYEKQMQNFNINSNAGEALQAENNEVFWSASCQDQVNTVMHRDGQKHVLYIKSCNKNSILLDKEEGFMNDEFQPAHTLIWWWDLVAIWNQLCDTFI